MDYFFAIKNYFRNDIVNLTIRSIRHFVPNAKIVCLNLYKDSISDYKDYEFIEADEIFYDKSKYDSGGRGGQHNIDNALFFAEGYNIIFNRYKHLNAKVLILAEDHFFTTGQTIREFIENDFDIAIADCGDLQVNGSILGINFNTNTTFPIPETVGLSRGCEHTFRDTISSKAKKLYVFTTRFGFDYKGDGIHSNDFNEIKNVLIDCKII